MELRIYNNQQALSLIELLHENKYKYFYDKYSYKVVKKDIECVDIDKLLDKMSYFIRINNIDNTYIFFTKNVSRKELLNNKLKKIYSNIHII